VRPGAAVNILVVVLTLGLLALVVLMVSHPLRRPVDADADADADPAGAGPHGRSSDAAAQDASSPDLTLTLEAERESKYSEIRDAELDFRTGKLSREDYQAIDADLRAEALAILDRLGSPAAGARDEAGEPSGVPRRPDDRLRSGELGEEDERSG
jgi:hypothetical protein